MQILHLVSIRWEVIVRVDRYRSPAQLSDDQRDFHRGPNRFHQLRPSTLVHVTVELGWGVEVGKPNQLVTLLDQQMDGENGVFAARNDSHEFHPTRSDQGTRNFFEFLSEKSVYTKYVRG